MLHFGRLRTSGVDRGTLTMVVSFDYLRYATHYLRI